VLDLGVSPGAFWRMTPAEFWILYKGKNDRQRKAAGLLTDEESVRLMEMFEKFKQENG
jgi:hypothetical protein